MSFNRTLVAPFYSGVGVSSDVPSLWDIAINGRTYMIDWRYAQEGQFSKDSIKLLKQQQDTSGDISERSLNPEEYARWGMDSWHKGAGQDYADRDDSDPARFLRSKGWDPWTKWKLQLLPDTEQLTSSAETNLALVRVGGYLYEVDGQQVYFRSTLAGARTSCVIHVAEAAQSVKGITTDGYYLYAALGSNGIHRSVRGATTSSHYSDLSATLIGYVKGRLMAANGNAIYNVTSSGAAPSALYTHPNSDFTWVGFASGLGCLYAAGYSGDKSLVYRTAVKADGTALDTPVVAGELPAGEIVRAVYGYLGFVLIGTDQGVRFATADDAGNLTIGALIETDGAVRCFEGQGRFVWFGWTNYDATSTGLGRLDLTVVNGTAPAYASDLMVTGQGNVLSVATFEDKRVLAVSGLGIYGEAAALVTEAALEPGIITYGLPDTKIAMNLDLRHESLSGSLSAWVSGDGGTFTHVGGNSTAGSTAVVLGAQTSAEAIELRIIGTRSDSDSTAGPAVTRLTLEANPAPGRGEFWTVPLLLEETVKLANGTDGHVDCAAEESALLSFETVGTALSVQTGAGSQRLHLDDHKFVIRGYTSRRDGWEGTFLARFKKPRQRSS